MGRKALSEITDPERARLLAWVRALPPRYPLSHIARECDIAPVSLRQFRASGRLGPQARERLAAWIAGRG